MKLMRVVGMAISVLVIVGCMAGVVGCWWLRGEVDALMARADDLVRHGTELAYDGVDGAERLVGEARQEVGRVEEKVQEELEKVDGPRIAAELVRRELRENLEPRLNAMRQQIAPLRDTLIVASGFVDVLVSVESVRERVIWLQDVRRVFDRLEELGGQIRLLAESLDRGAAGNPQGESEPVTAVTRVATEIDDRLAEIGELSAGLRTRVDEVETDARRFISRVTWAVNLSAVLMSAVMAWVIYSQGVVIRCLRSGRSQSASDGAVR